MSKPTIYVDTSIVSAYWYDGRDAVSLGSRAATRDWWDNERSYFELYISAVTLNEARDGKYRRQRQCIQMVRSLPALFLSNSIRELADELIQRGLIPHEKLNDALQLAIATHYQCDFLLTWNYAHLANAVVQSKLAALCQKKKLLTPALMSPDTIPQVRMGQSIRRRK